MKVSIVFEDVEGGVRVSLEGMPPVDDLPEPVPMSLILASICINRMNEDQESEKITVH